MTKSPAHSQWAATSSVFGANASFINACLAWRSDPGRDAPRFFPPEVVVQIKAVACELPSTLGLPLSRLSTADIVREVQRCGIVASISNKTVWRWLNEDAIRPWQHRCWIFPRGPDFASKAGRILDLYARQWEGRCLRSDEFVISADEKTSIQARIRKHSSLPTGPRPPASNMNIPAAAPGPTWQHSMFTEQKYLGAASQALALIHSIAWRLRS
jgi:hypothetical protein